MSVHAQPRRHHHHHHLASIGSERDLPLSANAAAAVAAAAGVDGPSHLLEAMLGALLVLVRECPEVRPFMRVPPYVVVKTALHCTTQSTSVGSPPPLYAHLFRPCSARRGR
jgi:hypothetical protein